MIKTFLIACACFVICLSCNRNKERKGSGSSGKTEKNKKVTKRDHSVTEANAYNDLFFDSLNLVKFITDNQLEDGVSRRMISFYNARNYQYAWFASNGLSEQARGFWNLHQYHTANTTDSSLHDKRFEKQMDNLAADDELSISAADKNILNAELKMTQHFILYALNNIEDGYLKRKELERFIPRKKESAMYLADSLLTKKHKDNKYYEDVNESYKQLKLQLQEHVDIARLGGWPVIEAATKQLKKGAQSSLVLPLKKRLSLSGDMPADTIPIFDDALTAAIRRFQVRHGYTPNGNLSEGLIRDMNVPVEQRIRQILINMGRMQWMIMNPKEN